MTMQAEKGQPMEVSELARRYALHAWQTPQTTGKEIDFVLAEAFARILEGWIRAAHKESDDAEHLRKLMVRLEKRMLHGTAPGADGTGGPINGSAQLEQSRP